MKRFEEWPISLTTAGRKPCDTSLKIRHCSGTDDSYLFRKYHHNLNAGEKAVKKFIKDVVDFNANPAGRAARTEYFENMIINSPRFDGVLQATDSELTMIGFVREKYYCWLKDNNIIPKTSDNYNCLGNEFYFYYHAIKNGNVYTLHRDTNKAKYLRFTLTDYSNAEIVRGKKFEKIEPWRAEIISTELVSRQKLKDILSDYPGKEDFQADYYYLVRAKVKDIFDGGIVAVSTEENDIISPYSPKIVRFSI